MSTIDTERDEEPSGLQRLALSFAIDDRLVEPLPTDFIAHIYFARPIAADGLAALEQHLREWVGDQQSSGEEPTGEVVYLGPQTVELRIANIAGAPDVVLPSLLQRLDAVSADEPIVQLDLD